MAATPNQRNLNNERGSALIFCVLTLFLLTAIGMLATKTTWIELDFARDDKIQKRAFYACDGGQETAKELIEDSLETRGWPDLIPVDSSDPEYVPGTDRYRIGTTYILNRDLWDNATLGTVVPADNDAERDAYVLHNNERTSIRMGGWSRLAAGGAIQMVSGYEGIGKGSAGGGAWLVYDIRDVHGGGGSASTVQLKAQWIHVM